MFPPIPRTKPDLVYFVAFLLAFLVTPGCQKEKNQQQQAAVKFADLPFSKPIQPLLIDEASGIADSKANAGYLWVEQDSGNPNDISLLSYAGQVFKKINIRSAVNRDWEDIALGNGPTAGVNYLYLADIGDNNKAYSNYTIYRFPEPASTIDTVSTYDKIVFEYPDGPHDAEAILVDNKSKDIYIITKQDAMSRLYRISYPQSTTAINSALYAGQLSFSGVVSAAQSATGDELLIKTYPSIYYWKKSGQETLEQLLAKPPTTLSYIMEPQGEAICFKNDNSGFYTLSERPSIIAEVNLNFYQRK